MDHQMTLEEFGIHINEGPVSILKEGHKASYAFPCGGCICNHCANSVECADHCTGEAEFGCFVCEECKHYGCEGACEDNWRAGCNRYKVTEAHAAKIRKGFRILRK